jgi:hypothetical protein
VHPIRTFQENIHVVTRSLRLISSDRHFVDPRVGCEAEDLPVMCEETGQGRSPWRTS